MDFEGSSDGNMITKGRNRRRGSEGICVQLKLQVKSSSIKGLRAKILGQTFWFQILAPPLTA